VNRVEKLIITAALTGAETTKEQNPNLPVTPQEIADAAYEAEQAGASIIHLHVRDRDGRPTQSVETFRQTISLIQKKCRAIIQVSTGGAVGMTAEERIAPISLKPEMATLTTGTVNFGDGVFLNPPEYIEHFAQKMKENGVKPEIEVFEAGMIKNALALVKKGLIQMPLHFDFVMGVPGGIPGEPRDLVYLVESIPAGSTWTVAGIGRYELTLGAMAIIMGGHVRVGFEDNIYYKKGELAESNAQLVERIVRLAGEFGREVATPDEARAILGIKKR
jgi:3-keto-5-aminohexanoate cleavage enzyme